MLLGFYKLVSEQHSAGRISGEIGFDRDHPVFSGHFPSVPVVPGVCMMQIIKEITEKAIGKLSRLQQASQLKFLTPINPIITPSVFFTISYVEHQQKLQISAELKNAEHSFFKMKAALITE